MERVLAVGLDGSPESLAAAHRAAAEAEPRDLTLGPHAWALLVPEPASGPAEAELLVVGRRKHHPVPGARPGPVARAAVHHARRPVAVVPHE